MRQGELQDRWDVNYTSVSLHFEKVYSRPKYPLASLRGLVSFVQYGISTIAADEPVGVPMLRMNNLQNDGWDLSDLKYIELSQDELGKYKILPGDILFNRTNSKELVGKCEVFKEAGDWVFASYLIRFRLDETKALPEFVSAFLGTKAGRLQIDRVSRQIIGMSNVNAEELQDLLIPLPNLKTQRVFVAEMESARRARQSKLAEAESLLAGIDSFVLDELRLKLPKEEKRNVFAVKQNELGKRLDAHFYRPYLRNAEEAVLSFKPEVKPLESLLEMSPLNGVDAREYLETGQKYLRVQNVRPFEISLDDVKYVEVESNKNVSLKSGDILLTRKGTFGVAAVVTNEFTDCLISSEVILLRLRSDSGCNPDYVTVWLNSKMGQILLDRYKAGGIMGHVTQDVVNMFPIPIASDKTQQKIVAELERRRAQARALRESAEREWQAAKEKFEKSLLG